MLLGKKYYVAYVYYKSNIKDMSTKQRSDRFKPWSTTTGRDYCLKGELEAL